MNALRIQELEEQIAFLQRHMEEQDKVILSMEQKADLLAKEIKRLEERIEASQEAAADNSASEPRPPHY